MRIRRARKWGSRWAGFRIRGSGAGRKWGKNISFGGVAAEEFDGGDALGDERVVDVAGEVVADGFGRDGDARRPFGDQRVDVREAVVAGLLQVVDQLLRVVLR
jgi:hypothetical protein